jgi:hypothetical protein
MNKKYLLIAIIFIAGFSYDSFAGHFDHFDHHEDHNDLHLSECQACEENVVVKIYSPKNKIFYKSIDYVEDVNSCSHNQRKKSNLSRAPPLN